MPKSAKFERDLIFYDRSFPLDVLFLENHPDYPQHTHDFSVIVIVAQGNGINIVGKEEFPLKVGDVFVLHERNPHGYRNTKNLSVINVIYDRALLNKVRFDIAGLPGYQALFVVEPALHKQGKFGRHLHLGMEDLGTVRTLAEAMEKELHGDQPRRPAVRFSERHLTATDPMVATHGKQGHRFMVMAHFMALVGLISRCYNAQPTSESEKIIKIGRAIGHMERHFEEDLDFDELAKMAGMSTRNFYRFFNKATKESPHAYLQRLRVMKGARILESTDKNVTEAAFACGFNDSGYFARQFRQVLGVSPREFQAGLKLAPPRGREFAGFDGQGLAAGGRKKKSGTNPN
jgi:AraC family L-rhamnose operon transcriptional activator RhaR/AraC family L-rhamnose operon regulatory protein RhaS